MNKNNHSWTKTMVVLANKEGQYAQISTQPTYAGLKQKCTWIDDINKADVFKLNYYFYLKKMGIENFHTVTHQIMVHEKRTVTVISEAKIVIEH